MCLPCWIRFWAKKTTTHSGTSSSERSGLWNFIYIFASVLGKIWSVSLQLLVTWTQTKSEMFALYICSWKWSWPLYNMRHSSTVNFLQDQWLSDRLLAKVLNTEWFLSVASLWNMWDWKNAKITRLKGIYCNW